MKKIIVLVIALALIGGAAFAGDNQSAKYLRMLSREADTTSIDAAYFNPAGTAFLAEGFHVQLNGQTVYLDYGNTFGGTEYSMQNWVPFVPAAYIGYNGGAWAAFVSYNIPEGGGSLDYDSIAVGFTSPVAGVAFGSLKASSATHAISVGGSYAITDMIAVGAKGEMSINSNSFDATIASDTIGNALVGTADLKTVGYGFGGAFGVHAKPIDGLNVSLTVETAQTIDPEKKDSSAASGTLTFLEGAADQMTADRPWKIRTGLSYTFPFGLEIPVSFKYSFWKAVDDDTKVNTWSTSFALRYFLNDALEFSVGGSYATGNSKDDQLDGTFMNPELDSFTIAGGVGFEIIDNLMLDVGMLYPIYFEEDGTNYTDMYKKVIDMGVSIGYTF